jgi:myo-inositol 2-dehydrogenase / D-chiro-inositol 1-dehydrogenase
VDAFATEFREWIAGIAAGREPSGPSAWDGYAATVITDAAVRSLESGGPVVTVDMKPRPAFNGGVA